MIIRILIISFLCVFISCNDTNHDCKVGLLSEKLKLEEFEYKLLYCYVEEDAFMTSDREDVFFIELKEKEINKFISEFKLERYVESNIAEDVPRRFKRERMRRIGYQRNNISTLFKYFGKQDDLKSLKSIKIKDTYHGVFSIDENYNVEMLIDTERGLGIIEFKFQAGQNRAPFHLSSMFKKKKKPL